MNRSFLYPTLNDELLENLKITVYEQLFYTTDKFGKQVRVNIDNEDASNIIMNDTEGIWNAEFNDLIIEQKIVLGNCKVLFGNQGIANKDSLIGVSVSWWSKSSKRRESYKIDTISIDDSKKSLSVTLTFPSSSFRKQVNYSVNLFSLDNSNENSIYANSQGLILGNIFESRLILEGAGSIFPIVSISDAKSPLWYLNCDWTDYNDSFSDSVVLILNKEHKNYRYLDSNDSKNYNNEMFIEVMISVTVQIIMTAVNKGDIEEITIDRNLVTGSIGELIKYYIDTYEISSYDITEVNKSIVKGVRNNG